MNRNGELAVVDEKGREKERYPVVYGAKIKVRDGKKATAGQVLVEWDPYTTPILTEVAGKLVYRDIEEGVTIHDEIDEVTGLASKVIIEDQGGQRQPRVSIKAVEGEGAGAVETDRTIGSYALPVKAHVMVARRGGGVRRRGHRQDSPGDDEDQGHHRRSPAGGGALRGPEAEGAGDHHRDRRRRALRRHPEGHAEDRGPGRRRRGEGVPRPARQAHHRARGRSGQGRRAAHGGLGEPARHPGRPRRQAAPGVPGRTRSRRSTGSRA